MCGEECWQGGNRKGLRGALRQMGPSCESWHWSQGPTVEMASGIQLQISEELVSEQRRRKQISRGANWEVLL